MSVIDDSKASSGLSMVSYDMEKDMHYARKLCIVWLKKRSQAGHYLAIVI